MTVYSKKPTIQDFIDGAYKCDPSIKAWLKAQADRYTEDYSRGFLTKTELQNRLAVILDMANHPV